MVFAAIGLGFIMVGVTSGGRGLKIVVIVTDDAGRLLAVGDCCNEVSDEVKPQDTSPSPRIIKQSASFIQLPYVCGNTLAAQRPGVSRVATDKNDSGLRYRSTHAAGQRRLHAVLGAF